MPPNWYSTLEPDLQTRLYVDYILCHESTEDANRRNKQAQQDRIQSWQSR